MEPRPDMNIKVAAITVSQKSINRSSSQWSSTTFISITNQIYFYRSPCSIRVSYVVGHVMELYSPDLTNIRFSFILLTVNMFRHPTLIEHGLYH